MMNNRWGEKEILCPFCDTTRIRTYEATPSGCNDGRGRCVRYKECRFNHNPEPACYYCESCHKRFKDMETKEKVTFT